MEKGNPDTVEKGLGEPTRTKTVVVMKRRHPGVKQRLPTCTNRSRGIPEPGRTSLVETAQAASLKDDTFDNVVDGSLLDDLPSDTLMVIHALQNNPETSILIPLLHNPHNSFLKAVLECQVHNRLRDSSCSSELQELLDSRDRNNSLVQLRAPSLDGTEDAPSVLLTTNDYIRGVYDARERHRMKYNDEEGDTFSKISKVVNWFVQHVRDWTGRYIRDSQVEDSFRQDPLLGFQGPQRVMEILQTIQVVLPSHELHAHQLWLPEWGTVLKAWQDSRSKLVANIKRSYYGEKSLKSLKQSTSPVPIELIVEWLKEIGVVQGVNRPSGIFIRLTKNTTQTM